MTNIKALVSVLLYQLFISFFTTSAADVKETQAPSHPVSYPVLAVTNLPATSPSQEPYTTQEIISFELGSSTRYHQSLLINAGAGAGHTPSHSRTLKLQQVEFLLIPSGNKDF